jgi:transcriptional regulator with XRE-family HTH domain
MKQNSETPRALLRRARESKGLSQEEMSRELETTLRTYQRWETGEVEKIPAEALQKAQAILADSKRRK